jgi:hypothetical protein
MMFASLDTFYIKQGGGLNTTAPLFYSSIVFVVST